MKRRQEGPRTQHCTSVVCLDGKGNHVSWWYEKLLPDQPALTTTTARPGFR